MIDLKNKYYKQAKKNLKEQYQIDVLNDIIMARDSRAILYGDVTEENPTLHVIGGNLSYFGFEDSESIKLSEILDVLYLDNKYAEVSGKQEYKDTIYGDVWNFTEETNITFPIEINNNVQWLRINVLPVVTHKDIRAFILNNVTKYRVGEEEMFEKTHKDSLTGLFNKYTLDYHYGTRYKFEDFHVLYLDLDDFKKINDKCGHVVGNDFLIEFANILKSHEDNYNRFYRIGGDEFVGFLFKSEGEIREIANDIIMRIYKYKHKECKHSTSVSIGIVKAVEAEDVIRKADKVLYDVKETGKNHFEYRTEDQIKK